MNLNVVSLYPDINEYSSLKNWDSSISGNGFYFQFHKVCSVKDAKKMLSLFPSTLGRTCPLPRNNITSEFVCIALLVYWKGDKIKEYSHMKNVVMS